MILLNDGRRLTVGTNLWIRDHGMLITQRQEEVAQADAETTKRAMFVQRVIHELDLTTRSSNPYTARNLALDEVSQTAGAAPIFEEAGGGLWLSNFLNGVLLCRCYADNHATNRSDSEQERDKGVPIPVRRPRGPRAVRSRGRVYAA